MNRAMEQIWKEIQKQQRTYSCYTSEQQVLRKKPFSSECTRSANRYRTQYTCYKEQTRQYTNHDSFSALSCEKLVNYCLLLHWCHRMHNNNAKISWRRKWMSLWIISMLHIANSAQWSLSIHVPMNQNKYFDVITEFYKVVQCRGQKNSSIRSVFIL